MGIVFGIGSYEEPKFEKQKVDGAFEIRKYHPNIVAEVTVEGSMDEASSKGFRLIANYIFGGNVSTNGGKGESIAMTAPVVMKPAVSESIAMTAPVVLQPAGGTDVFSESKLWKIQFVMPSSYSLDTLPTPNNAAVKLLEAPGKLCGAVSFSGWWTEVATNQQTTLLRQWLQTHGYTVIGEPQLLRYNPPWLVAP